MKQKLFRIIALLLILINLSSCFENKWFKYHRKYHYIHKKNYAKMHARHNRDW